LFCGQKLLQINTERDKMQTVSRNEISLHPSHPISGHADDLHPGMFPKQVTQPERRPVHVLHHQEAGHILAPRSTGQQMRPIHIENRIRCLRHRLAQIQRQNLEPFRG